MSWSSVFCSAAAVPGQPGQPGQPGLPSGHAAEASKCVLGQPPGPRQRGRIRPSHPTRPCSGQRSHPFSPGGLISRNSTEVENYIFEYGIPVCRNARRDHAIQRFHRWNTKSQASTSALTRSLTHGPRRCCRLRCRCACRRHCRCHLRCCRWRRRPRWPWCQLPALFYSLAVVHGPPHTE